MAATTSRRNRPLDSSLRSLSLSGTKASSQKPSSSAPESWEDELSSPVSPSTPTNQSEDPSFPGPPPPTPISPSHHRRGQSTDWSVLTTSYPNTKLVRQQEDTKRPEKSAAAASRMISGALGVKNKMTDEQKEYERAVREKARKKAESEREEKRRREKEGEEARRAIWED